LASKIAQYKDIRRNTVAGCQRRLTPINAGHAPFTITTVNISKHITIQTKLKQCNVIEQDITGYETIIHITNTFHTSIYDITNFIIIVRNVLLISV